MAIKMILTEIRTEAEYEFLKLWNSCELIIWDKYPESLFMVNDDKEILFEQDWKNGFLWCKYSTVWSFFESKFGYNRMQISQMISGILEEHLKNRVLTPKIRVGSCFFVLEEHLKNRVLTPTTTVVTGMNLLEEHLKNRVLTPVQTNGNRLFLLKEHIKNGILTPMSAEVILNC